MSSKTFKYLLVFLMSILILTPEILQAEGNKKDGGNKRLNKPNAQTAFTFLDINNISTYFYNNGISDISPAGNSGFVYPKGSGKTAVFTSGLLWGAKVAGDVDPRVGGTAYRTGLTPGKVLANGKADDPALDKYRIYRVRRDIYPGGPSVDLTAAGLNEGSSPADLRANYEQDWAEWPADMGAPFDDKNNDGVYQSSIDIPGVPGADQTLWFVANDLTAGQTTFLYGANPLGLEVQATFWAYNKAGALGNTYFRKYKLINITNRTSSPISFQDMYFSMWSDVDLGDAGDDYVGVDTTLSLQYCYNATGNDNTYSPLPPPAVGFDFFQGPLVTGVAGQDLNRNGIDDATDFGIFNSERVGPGKINLPMTAAYYFANGDPNIGDPPQGEINGSRQFYNFFQGKFGVSGAPFINLVTGQPTNYALNGDPVQGTGWLDGAQLPAGDRRQGSASGPFNMAPGDTQEVVVAEIVAGATPGSDNLKAITSLRILDAKAQEAYDAFFKLPDAPPQPVVVTSTFDKTVVLDWGSSPSDVANTENNVNKTFTFQGYNVYQLPTASSSKEAGVRIATYDIKDTVLTILDRTIDPTSGVELLTPAQFGTNIGISRSIVLKKDYIKQSPLINGIKYYYAVTSYSYSPNPTEVPNNLENPLQIITAIPQPPLPGVRLSSTPGDTIKTVHSSGSSDGSAFALVVDPSRLTGHNYKVTFDDTTSPGTTTWNLIDVTDNNKIVLSKQTNLSGDSDYLTPDGFLLKVTGPPLTGKDWSYTSASPLNVSPVMAAQNGFQGGARWFTGGDHGGELLFGGVFLEPNFWGETSVKASEYEKVEIRFRPMQSYTDLNGNSKFDIGEPYVVDDTTKAQKAFMYSGFSASVYEGFFNIPFSAWDVTDPANARQLNVVHRDRDKDKQWQLHHQTVPADTLLPRNGDQQFPYTWILTSTYDPTGTKYGDGTGGSTDFWSYDGGNGIWDAQWTMWLDERGTSRGMLAEEGVLTLIPNLVNTNKDVFTFSAVAPTSSLALAKEDVEKINVFPNPYYGVNTEELNKYNRFVTFSHLPAKVTIRIFNLAGVLVKKIEKVGTGQFQRWDLANDSGLPVASGLYIAYIEMPDLGKTKILKVAVIQEKQILDRF